MEWNEDAIKARANRLAGLAVSIWFAPELPHDILDTYHLKFEASTEYTINDHPNLLTASLRPVFETFRKAVLALDPCVSEEFLKLYVAYKAETNFVDVVPQAKRLRISLNPEIGGLLLARAVASVVSDFDYSRRWLA